MRFFYIFSKKCPIDFQQVTKKMHILLKIYRKLFGSMKKKQYLCSAIQQQHDV